MDNNISPDVGRRLSGSREGGKNAFISSRKPSGINRYACLQCIENWPDRAHRARYRVQVLARMCGVSLRQLERFTHAAHQKTPHQWGREMRLRRALELICDRSSCKETAAKLGYKTEAHFSNDFKKYYGIAPSRYHADGKSGGQLQWNI